MSRTSTIDTKEATNGKMVVVLEKNWADSEKKKELVQSFTPSNGGGHHQNHSNTAVLMQ